MVRKEPEVTTERIMSMMCCQIYDGSCRSPRAVLMSPIRCLTSEEESHEAFCRPVLCPLGKNGKVN